MENKTEDFKNIKALVIITATSNKIDDDYKQEHPSKTVYFKPVDEKSKQILIDNGFTEYSSKEPDEDGNINTFFICKASQKVSIYDKEHDEAITELPFTIETSNIYTTEPVLINLVKVKNKKKGHNDFTRLNAIKVKSLESIMLVEKTNPFNDEDGIDLP